MWTIIYGTSDKGMFEAMICDTWGEVLCETMIYGTCTDKILLFFPQEKNSQCKLFPLAKLNYY